GLRLGSRVLRSFARQDHDVVLLEVVDTAPPRISRGKVARSTRETVGELVGAVAGIEMDTPVVALLSDLRIVDTHAAEETLERVRVARRQRDLRHVAFAPVLRQTRLRRGQRGIGALADARDRDLAAPLTTRDHERDVLPGRHTGERELAGLVRGRDDTLDRRAGELVVIHAATALDLVADRRHRRVRHVDLHAVERQRAVRRVHRARDRRVRHALRRAIDDVAFEARALVLAFAATVGRADIAIAALATAGCAERIAEPVGRAVITGRTR